MLGEGCPRLLGPDPVTHKGFHSGVQCITGKALVMIHGCSEKGRVCDLSSVTRCPHCVGLIPPVLFLGFF